MTRQSKTGSRLLCVLGTLVSMIGCLEGPETIADPFGYEYRIATVSHGSPRSSVAPTLSGSLLHVTVEYRFCGPEHRFVLEGRVNVGNEAVLWIRKVTPDQLCYALAVVAKEFVVPRRLLACHRITLRGPDGTEYELR